MKLKTAFLATLASAMLATTAITLAAAQTPSNIIVFGDSLSDIGNNNWIYATGTPITNLDSKGNKFTWVNYLADSLFKQPAWYSDYPNKSHQFSYVNNVSYAYAGADTSNDYLNADWPVQTSMPAVNADCSKPGLLKNLGTVTSACVPGLLKQVDLYLSDVRQKPYATSLFFIWAGGNDLFYKLPTTDETPEQIKQIIGTAVMNIVQAKNTLMDHGVSPQQIYVLNLPDLSSTPFAIKLGLNDLTALTLAFNGSLATAVTASDSKHAGLDGSHVISMYDLMNNIVLNPDQYQLTNTTESCVENFQAPLCQEYLFYDLKHPTAQMHKTISDFIRKSL